MLSSTREDSDVKIVEPREHPFRIWMLAILLIVLGLVVIWKFPEHRVLSTAADAVLIAGILALGVDPLLKRDLLVEASKGIFIHLLGFEHHPQVKDKLQKIIYETKLLREELRETIIVEPCDDGFWVTASYETDIINPTYSNVSITPNIEFDKGHKPQSVSMSFTSTDGAIRWTSKNVVLEELRPGLLSAAGEKIDCRPTSTGVTYRGTGTYKTLSRHGYFMIFIGKAPTLRTYVTVEVPDGYEVSGTTPDVRNDNCFEYNEIMMPGDHITIRWREKNGEWL